MNDKVSPVESIVKMVRMPLEQENDDLRQQLAKLEADLDEQDTDNVMLREKLSASEASNAVMHGALEDCVCFIDELKDHGIYGWSREGKVKDALAAYRGLDGDK